MELAIHGFQALRAVQSQCLDETIDLKPTTSDEMGLTDDSRESTDINSFSHQLPSPSSIFRIASDCEGDIRQFFLTLQLWLQHKWRRNVVSKLICLYMYNLRKSEIPL